MRYFLVALFIHLLVVSFVWIGFSTPSEHGSNSFTYIGGIAAETKENSHKSLSQPYESIIFKNSSAAFFEPWLRMRELNKPR
jgi:hypothetical protein